MPWSGKEARFVFPPVGLERGTERHDLGKLLLDPPYNSQLNAVQSSRHSNSPKRLDGGRPLRPQPGTKAHKVQQPQEVTADEREQDKLFVCLLTYD